MGKKMMEEIRKPKNRIDTQQESLSALWTSSSSRGPHRMQAWEARSLYVHLLLPPRNSLPLSYLWTLQNLCLQPPSLQQKDHTQEALPLPNFSNTSSVLLVKFST